MLYLFFVFIDSNIRIHALVLLVKLQPSTGYRPICAELKKITIVTKFDILEFSILAKYVMHMQVLIIKKDAEDYASGECDKSNLKHRGTRKIKHKTNCYVYNIITRPNKTECTLSDIVSILTLALI